MLRYSLKRFILSIPVLWFLITLVFLSSRLLPGTYGSETILYSEGAGYLKGTQEQRDIAYLSYLKRTGQDLPAFYFSIKTKADRGSHSTDIITIEKLPEALLWSFGDQDKVYAYYHAINTLEAVLSKNQDQKKLSYLFRLKNTVNPDSILLFSKMLSEIPGQSHSLAKNLRQAAVELSESENSLQYLLPVFQWHGTHNQYHQWFTLLLKGDLGTSFKDSRPVATIIWEAISNTFWLSIISMVLVILIALELSIVMVQKSSINWHKILLPVLFVLDSIPLFVLSLILLVLFATPDFLPLFPVFGLGYYNEQTGSWFDQLFQTGPYLVLPIACLVLVNLPYITNQTYRSLADTMRADYIKTARSKGLKERSIIRKHALRNALLPVITVLSDFLPALVAGTVIIETIFAIPGVGRLLITSVLARDIPVVIGIVLLVACMKMISHFIADVCYAQADPRVRKGNDE